MNKLRLIVTAAACIFIAGCYSGCKTANPTTGVKEFDPVKTEKVKAAIEPIVSSAVRRVVASNPKHSDEIALYLRAVGGAVCSISDTGEASPETLIAAIDAATVNLQAGVDPEIIDGKNAIIAVYKILYADRFKAELPPDEWPKNVCDVICQAIDQGLKDAGKPGVRN